MRWGDMRGSDNVEDREGAGPPGRGLGGGLKLGSSAQRGRWFPAGFDSGDVRQCNTFTTARP